VDGLPLWLDHKIDQKKKKKKEGKKNPLVTQPTNHEKKKHFLSPNHFSTEIKLRKENAKGKKRKKENYLSDRKSLEYGRIS
jgi:hypothetical protein